MSYGRPAPPTAEGARAHARLSLDALDAIFKLINLHAASALCCSTAVWGSGELYLVHDVHRRNFAASMRVCASASS